MLTCRIISCDQQHEPIILEHKKPLVIGRGPLTTIKDPRVSRNQILLVADCKVGKLYVRQFGANVSKAGSTVLKRKDSVFLENGGLIELLEHQYPYKVEFDSGPDCSTTTTTEVEMAGKQTSISSFFEKRKSSDESANGSQPKKQKTEDFWTEVDEGKLLIFTSDGIENKSKIAAFDLDGTIITTKSGKVFPTNCQDWKFLFTHIPDKLKQLREEGYKIVLFTNQAGIGNGKIKPLDFRQKLADICFKLEIPIQVFISIGTGMYRKPVPGMWNYFIQKANGDVPVEVGSSFYCGDAAGRQAKWAPNKKKDHSLADRLFATNIGLKFYTPEEYFLKHRLAAFRGPEFRPATLDASIPLLEPSTAKLFKTEQEVIMMVGFPGSGKSYFASYHASQSGYDVINRDTLGTWQKCSAEMQRSLDSGKSVLIDNTNPDKESRERFIVLALARKLPCRCFLMNTTATHALHNIKFREITDQTHARVPRMVFNIYKSKYQEPILDEGFNEIVRVNFRPEFQSPEEESLYKMYLLED